MLLLRSRPLAADGRARERLALKRAGSLVPKLTISTVVCAPARRIAQRHWRALYLGHYRTRCGSKISFRVGGDSLDRDVLLHCGHRHRDARTLFA